MLSLVTRGLLVSSIPFLSPVQSLNEFFGRKNEIRRMMGFLRQKQNVSIVAQNPLGKTSILNVLSHPEVMAHHQMEHATCLFIRLEGVAMAEISQDACCAYIYHSIQPRLPQPLARPDSVAFYDLSRLCRGAARMGVYLILCIDQFDRLAENSQLDVSFFDGLRSLSSAGHVTFLTASHKTLSVLQGTILRLSGSPFFNIFQLFELEPLAEPDGRSLLLHRLQTVGIGLPPDVIEWVLSWANGRPRHLQFAAHHAIELSRQNNPWDDGSTNALKKELSNLDMPDRNSQGKIDSNSRAYQVKNGRFLRE